VVFLGESGNLFTTGFSKFSDRQYAVWSQEDLSQPLVQETIDSSSGVLVPHYDPDTRMIYVAGKGDGNVRYYEVVDGAPWVCYLSQFISGAPQKGFGVLPKRGVDVTTCEVFRLYKLHATKDVVEPISMIVPRKSDSFQDDIYPETAAPVPALTGRQTYFDTLGPYNKHLPSSGGVAGWQERQPCPSVYEDRLPDAHLQAGGVQAERAGHRGLRPEQRP
jgi:coronin-2